MRCSVARRSLSFLSINRPMFSSVDTGLHMSIGESSGSLDRTEHTVNEDDRSCLVDNQTSFCFFPPLLSWTTNQLTAGSCCCSVGSRRLPVLWGPTVVFWGRASRKGRWSTSRCPPPGWRWEQTGCADSRLQWTTYGSHGQCLPDTSGHFGDPVP